MYTATAREPANEASASPQPGAELGQGRHPHGDDVNLDLRLAQADSDDPAPGEIGADGAGRSGAQPGHPRLGQHDGGDRVGVITAGPKRSDGVGHCTRGSSSDDSPR